MSEQEQGFTLEDIIREFSDHPDKNLTGEETPEQPAAEPAEEIAEEPAQEPAEKIAEEPAQEPAEKIAEEPAQEPAEKIAEEPAQEPACTGDTLRVDTEVVAAQLKEQEESALTGDTVRVDTEAVAAQLKEQEESALTGDTVRVDTEAVAAQLKEQGSAPVTGDTVRLDTALLGRGESCDAQPAEEDAQQPAGEETPQQEPFSENWEPEYEQPIADYVPPRPVLIHPRSKIRELKKQLVAGPEKEYYALLERGVGKLQVAMFFSLLVVLISAVATFLYALDMVGPDRMKLMIFGQLLAMLISALLGSYQLLEGLADLKNKRFSLNTLLCFSFALCVADGVLCLQDLRVPCCAAFGLQMTMSLWNAYQRRNTRLGQLDTMRKATQLIGIGLQEQYFEDQAALLRGEGRVDDFMESYGKPSRLSKTVSVYAIIVLCVSVALGIGAGVYHGLGGDVMTGVSIGIQTAAVSLLVAVPASMLVTISRPLAVLERRLHSLGAVICGWRGIEGLSKKVLFPVTHEDLFPGNTVKLNGVKFYGDRESDQVVAYATALICADGGILSPIFEHLLESRNGIHYKVEEFNPYGNGGIGGVVNEEPVLVGTLEFLKEMGVEIPAGIQLKHAVAISVDGQMCGLFALTYDRHRAAAAGLQSLCGYRGLKPVLTSQDFMLTGSFIAGKFSVKAKRIFFPEYSQRKELRQKQLEQDKDILAITTTDNLAAAAFCVTGARTAKRACNAGMVVHMIGGVLGIAMIAVLAFVGARELLTPSNMLLYQLIWTVPGILITEWTRAI
ncbi:MAG: hypothetical protein IJO56_04525 [Oscillospiraceae bacterium]|nr:hypothetical protein [Oscillospiraceae bacterium]